MLGALCRSVSELDPLDLTLRLTLLDLLLRPIGDWTIRPAVLALAAAALVVPHWLRRPGIWLALAVLTGMRVLGDWPLADNHAYLLCYWCIAVTLSLAGGGAAASLAWNGRLLIGLVFAFATLWKLILSPDYLDGTFFRVALVMDPRFEGLSRLAGGASPELLEASRLALGAHVDGLVSGAAPPVAPSRLVWLARLATGWTAVLEAAVALAFLWPGARGPARVRDAALLLFVATTYAVAPVEGFGWLLVTMGVAQCGAARPGVRVLYLASFALILFYREVPWATLLANRLGS